MKNIRNIITNNKTIVLVALLGYIVFTNYFSFPIINFGNKSIFEDKFMFILFTILNYAVVGGFLALILPGKKYIHILALLILFSIIGLVCKYFIEFGEVSTSINFTLMNISYHLIGFIASISLGWLYISRLRSNG